jgi:hypothetical protein
MDTFDTRRDPCAEAIASMMITSVDATPDQPHGEGTAEPMAAFVPGRERPIKYMQHPAYRRSLRVETLAA